MYVKDIFNYYWNTIKYNWIFFYIKLYYFMLKFIFLNTSFTKQNPRSIEFSLPSLLSFTYLKLLCFIWFFHIVNTYLYIFIIKIPYIFHLQPEIEFCFIFLTCQEKIYKANYLWPVFYSNKTALSRHSCIHPYRGGINNDSLKQKS